MQSRGRRSVLIDDAEAFDRLCQRDTLLEAWTRVWRNQGAAGGDRVTVHDFAAGAHHKVAVLALDLREGRYQPRPMRRVDIPKRKGGRRTLTIPSVVDRIAQTAAAAVLMPGLEEEFEDASFGYRPGRSVQQAVAGIQRLQRAGLTHVIDADIDDYFDSVPHDGLIERLAQSLSPGPLTELIALWLAHGAPQGRGLAQGSPLSPLLANLYLDRLDEAFARRGARIIRFADDFVILTSSKKRAEEALDDVEDLLRARGLRLNRDKTQITDFDAGFQFLGHLFVRSMALKSAPEDADDFDQVKALAALAEDDAAHARAAEAAAEAQADQEARGYAPGFRTLYVMQKGRRLAIRNQAFTVEERVGVDTGSTGPPTRWRELIAVPHQRVDRIDLGPGIEATSEALDHALATSTVLCYVDGFGATRGTLAPPLGPRAGRHLAQAAVIVDPVRRLELARVIVLGRLRNQRALLRKLCRERDVTPAPVIKAIATLTGLIGRGDTSRIVHAPSLTSVMGYEGAATAAYWRGLSSLTHVDFRFARRIRSDDPGPGNIALNFLSHLLNRDTMIAVQAAGLHPGFGALHTASDRHDACVYDLMEEFRAHLVEGLFVYVCNRRMLRPEMFSRQPDGGWRMRPTGIKALIRAYETRASSLIASGERKTRMRFRRVMIKQARDLAAHYESNTPYRPFEIDY